MRIYCGDQNALFMCSIKVINGQLVTTQGHTLSKIIVYNLFLALAMPPNIMSIVRLSICVLYILRMWL